MQATIESGIGKVQIDNLVHQHCPDLSILNQSYLMCFFLQLGVFIE